MNIEKFDIKLIEELSAVYNLIKMQFGKKIETNNLKIQKKIRNWIYKNNYIELTENAIKVFDSLSDNEFIHLLKECYEYTLLNGCALEQQINNTCADFSDSVKKLFFHLFDREYYVDNDFKLSDGVLEILVEATASYEAKLVLFDAKYSTNKKFDTFCFYENCSLIKENNRYKLTGEASLYSEEEPFEISVDFAFAESKIEIYNASNTFIDCTPWEQLTNISISIIDKENFENSINELEKKLFPLLKEIKYLSILNDDISEGLPNLKALVLKHNFLELLPLIEKIESKEVSEKRRFFLSKKLINKLDFIKYKPLWQEIYNLICQSQKDYPTNIEIKKSKSVVTRFKNNVTGLMRENGYSGEYPEFYKRSSLNGVHLFESYNVSYTVAFERNVVHHVHCEEVFDDKPGIFLKFEYGTEFLKKGEAVGDINDCRFNCKGKKYASSLMFYADFDESKMLPLQERIKLVTKLAEFKKLSKEEKLNIFDVRFSFRDRLTLFILIFIFAGFFFASLFIPAMMAFSAFMLWIDGMPVVISDVPWLTFYFGSWAAFGLPVGLIMAFLKK